MSDPEKPKPSELDHKLRLLVEPVTQSPEADELYKSQLEEDSKLRPGEIISVDDVPVSPVSLDNYNTFFIFRDTKPRTLFSFTRVTTLFWQNKQNNTMNYT